MCIKINLVKRYMDLGCSRSLAIKLAEKRARDQFGPLAAPSAEVIARRLLEQNIWSQKP